MDFIISRFKLILIIVAVLVMLFAGWRLFQQHDNSREAACRRAAAENLGPNQGISADAAVCDGTMEVDNPQ